MFIKLMELKNSSYFYTDLVSQTCFIKFTIYLHCILAFVYIFIPNRTKIKTTKYQHNNIELKVCRSSLRRGNIKTKHMMNE